MNQFINVASFIYYFYNRVYCKFHSMNHQSFNNSEEELLYFVKLFQNESMIWSEQYGYDSSYEGEDEEHRKLNRY